MEGCLVRAILTLLILLVHMVLIPVLEGLLPCSLLPAKKRTLPAIILTGYAVTFATLELLGLPVLFLTELGEFPVLKILFLVVSLVIAAAGIVLCGRSGSIKLLQGFFAIRTGKEKDGGKRLFNLIHGEPEQGTPHEHGLNDAAIMWTLFACLLIAQLFMAYTRAYFDGDDAYYVTQSVITWQTDTMYRYLPYTGITTTVDARHALALFPMWAAYLAKMSGTHPTIILHSMMPLVLIPLADLVVYCLVKKLAVMSMRGAAGAPAAAEAAGSAAAEGTGSALAASKAAGGAAAAFEEDNPEFRASLSRITGTAMAMTALLQIFGNVSIYTPETFLMMRTWQGKAILAAILLPATFLALVNVAEKYADGARAGESTTDGSVMTVGEKAAEEGWKAELKFAYAGLALLCAASGIFTSMAPLLIFGLIAAAALLMLIMKLIPRKAASLLLLCGLPCVCYLVMALLAM